ncbi:MAG: TIGR04282 family arsenosugar biosynthesis glycosyltransferase [Nitrospirae bacterium]|nr:TIGR04282 family arsenosugar biosynthesis glycosyltransferase [Nitrospirota bacterium]
MKSASDPGDFRRALVLFAKAPVPGKVKTRLFPILTPEESAELYGAFVLDTVELMGRLEGVTPFIACHPSREEKYFQDLAAKHAIHLLDQEGEDLGARMERTFRALRGEGWDQVVILGTDSPTLPAAILASVFSALSAGSAGGETARVDGSSRVVIGPTFDGGYYLIGISGEPPPLFTDIPWSAPRVLEKTLERLDSPKISCTLLPFWYDVDTPEDLRFLTTHLRYLETLTGNTAFHTRTLLQASFPSGR